MNATNKEIRRLKSDRHLRQYVISFRVNKDEKEIINKALSLLNTETQSALFKDYFIHEILTKKIKKFEKKGN